MGIRQTYPTLYNIEIGTKHYQLCLGALKSNNHPTKIKNLETHSTKKPRIILDLKWELDKLTPWSYNIEIGTKH